MNFLAHLFLAGQPTAPDYAGLVVGQFIADSVPGRQLEHYPPAVQAGIRLHRAIDTFTDQHPVVRRSTRRLREAGYGKYAGVVSDIFLDHFLARHFTDYSVEALPVFTQRLYALLNTQQALMPEQAQRTLHYMALHDWLCGYAHLEGIGRALNGLSQRAWPGSGMETAGEELWRNYAAYEEDFQEFFPELQELVESMLNRTSC